MRVHCDINVSDECADKFLEEFSELCKKYNGKKLRRTHILGNGVFLTLDHRELKQ